MSKTAQQNLLAAEETGLSEAKPQNSQPYKVYSYRYIIGGVYSLTAIQNVLMWLIFAPLQTTLKNVYHQSIEMISFSTILISNVCYIPSNFVASYLIDTYGLRFGIILGAVLTTIGLWIRCLCKESFYFIFIGQCFAGVAQPFFYSTPQKISNTWFNTEERTLATTVIAISLNIGNGLGAFLPQFFVDMNSTDSEKILDQLRFMMISMACMGTIVLCIVVFLFKEKPLTPPSKSAAAPKFSYKESLKTFMKDKNAIIFLLASATITGTIFTYSSVIQQLVDPYEIDGQQVGNIMFLGILVGFIGAGLGGAYVSKTKKYKSVIQFFGILSLLVLVVNYFSVTTKNVYIFGFSFMLYAFLITPVLPLSMETIVEYSFPVAEATVGGLWFGATQLLATGDSFAVNYLIGDEPTPETGKRGFLLMVCVQFAAVLLLIYVKENLKRTRFEKTEVLEESKGNKESNVYHSEGFIAHA